jgi:predicted DNA-binding transcriptional regulator YafY
MYFGDTVAMRASRLLSLLMILQTRGRASARQLAEALEVSVRTIHRDIDELSAAGVPVWADRGRAGGFQLQPGWRTRVDGLTAPEAQAMFLGGLPGPASELGLGEAMASAQLKLLAALPDGWRDDARRVSARFHLDPIDWYRGPSATDHLPAVAQAVWGEHRIAIRYDSWKGEVERRVDPLGLVLKAGVWYLVALAGASSSGQAGPRMYRVSNVLALTPTQERFERPAGFDLAAWWQASTRRFEAGLQRETAVLRVSPDGMKALRDLGQAVADAAAASAGRADAQGWRRVTIPIESVAHGARQVMRLGVEAKVVRPAALRRELLARVDAIAGVYRRLPEDPRARER